MPPLRNEPSLPVVGEADPLYHCMGAGGNPRLMRILWARQTLLAWCLLMGCPRVVEEREFSRPREYPEAESEPPNEFKMLEVPHPAADKLMTFARHSAATWPLAVKGTA